MHDHSDRQAFHDAYATFSTAVYSSALRISGDKTLAQEILSEVYLDLHRRGLLATPGVVRLSNLLPALFDCVAAILKAELPEQVIRHRIAEERQYLLRQTPVSQVARIAAVAV